MLITGLQVMMDMQRADGQLRKTCQHPYLSAPELEDESLPEAEQHKRLYNASGKLAFLRILLPKLKERGHRVLLFSQVRTCSKDLRMVC